MVFPNFWWNGCQCAFENFSFSEHSLENAAKKYYMVYFERYSLQGLLIYLLKVMHCNLFITDILNLFKKIRKLNDTLVM